MISGLGLRSRPAGRGAATKLSSPGPGKAPRTRRACGSLRRKFRTAKTRPKPNTPLNSHGARVRSARARWRRRRRRACEQGRCRRGAFCSLVGALSALPPGSAGSSQGPVAPERPRAPPAERSTLGEPRAARRASQVSGSESAPGRAHRAGRGALNVALVAMAPIRPVRGRSTQSRPVRVHAVRSVVMPGRRSASESGLQPPSVTGPSRCRRRPSSRGAETQTETLRRRV